jgi:hypothetical protein
LYVGSYNIILAACLDAAATPHPTTPWAWNRSAFSF